jgi:thioredoxin 1
MSENIQELTDANFASVISTADKPVVVDFWAEWCGPCKQIAPILEELAVEQAERFTIGKLNVDEQRAIAGQYSIMSIPTLMVFKNGEMVGRIVGAKPKAALLEEIVRSI